MVLDETLRDYQGYYSLSWGVLNVQFVVVVVVLPKFMQSIQKVLRHFTENHKSQPALLRKSQRITKVRRIHCLYKIHLDVDNAQLFWRIICYHNEYYIKVSHPHDNWATPSYDENWNAIDRFIYFFIFLFFKGKKVDLEVRFLSKLQRNPSS